MRLLKGPQAMEMAKYPVKNARKAHLHAVAERNLYVALDRGVHG